MYVRSGIQSVQCTFVPGEQIVDVRGSLSCFRFAFLQPSRPLFWLPSPEIRTPQSTRAEHQKARKWRRFSAVEHVCRGADARSLARSHEETCCRTGGQRKSKPAQCTVLHSNGFVHFFLGASILNDTVNETLNG